MRAPLLALVCLSSALTCRSDALGHERSFNPNASDALPAIDLAAIGAARAVTSASVQPTGSLISAARARITESTTREPASQPAPQTPKADPVATKTSESDATPSPEPRQLHYALARHLERAEQQRDGIQLFDFGEPGDAKYTFGGWLGHHTTHEMHGARSTLRLRANNLKLVLPADSDDVAQLTLGAHSFGPASLVVYVNGHAAGKATLAGQAIETVSFKLDPGKLSRGDNRVELRLYNKGKTREPGFALDYVALARREQDEAEAVVPAPIGHSVLRPDPNRDRLVLPPRLALTYTFEVPEHARWSATVHSGEPSELQVRVLRDNEAAQLLGSVETNVEAVHTAFDLSDYAGQLVQLELSAGRGAVSLNEPAITTPATPSTTRAQTERPKIRNVVLYLIDTLRADKLSPYNTSTRVRTPGLSKFLQGASVVTSARSQENWTKPSVATLLSSLFPWEHNTFSDAAVLPRSVLVLPEHLQGQGFFTGAFIANGYVSDKFGFGRGFDTYRNYIREGRRSAAESVASDVLEWFDKRPQDKPFFLYVHTIDAHVPYRPPSDFLELYDSAPYKGPVNFSRSATLLEEIKLGKLPLGVRDKERLEALYDGAISYHDVYFDAILTGLEKRGLSGDTMVVVTADHGEEFWDHGSVGHGHSLYDELLHVPLMFRVPGVTQAGDRVDSNAGLIDVAPTILDALGQAPWDAMSGRSLMPELLGDTADAPRASVSGFMTGLRSLAVGRFKLVQRGLSHSSLYDTAEDPHEASDLAAARPIALGYTRSLMGLMLASESDNKAPRAPKVHAAQKTQIDAETEQQLRALGYVGSSRH